MVCDLVIRGGRVVSSARTVTADVAIQDGRILAVGNGGALAGRAQEILTELEEKSEAPRAIPASTQRLQMTLFEVEEPPVVRALQKLDVNQLTPLEALKLLDDWKRKFV